MNEINTSFTNDLAFTDFFGNPKNKKYLEYLVECLFEKNENYYLGKLNLVTLEKTIPKEHIHEKRGRLDLVFEVEHELLNLEMYTSFSKNSLRKSAFYVVSTLNQELKCGNDYKGMKKIYQINFVSKISGLDLKEECKTVLTNYPLTDVCEMVIIRLDLLDNVDYNNFKNKKLLQFLKFLVADTYEKRKRQAEGSEILMEMNEKITDYFKDPDFLKNFDFLKNREEIKYNDGLDEGEARGILLGQEMMAKKMLAKSKSLEEIMEYTELSKEKILKIQSSMVI